MIGPDRVHTRSEISRDLIMSVHEVLADVKMHKNQFKIKIKC